ncbi:16S rRNA (adenine(1518)-N(6)/adenine(1519)-N(6))-dimethyltransferase RsmA [Allobranchiibius sp. CTAmp26]|uniref:16S rRNA (adenine(1518)-N(6)/adenine(1519)-N(6))- dimethyltransferase RsmA n=1 Tax=Allobranchiibius sp. CTAmp26 TaxID=2815214 RepID=UPI001AA157C1|nr:16S rRNA (adenine(1518)-N(6)/adenine(1519)-N(6))-dimethyltransferase RsmA [Allobranchiibius sp. CTAmp26]MBO1753512.1 16S rRNA (adenine(1518)-N(6)/adenine(1519)-N(6))-dimethyltransferase RsmA [Allobranchiibius sp. CTAmp26]
MTTPAGDGLLGATQVRALAAELGLRPTKQWGQNFVIDANTVRKIARLSGVGPGDQVVEVGPGLGSLTLALLECAGGVTAVEIDPALARRLPQTVREVAPSRADRLQVVQSDALRTPHLPDPQPVALVANLPYNVSVPVVLSYLEWFPSIARVLVMVQWEVAARLAAPPGSRVYGAPSAKAAWYAEVRLADRVGRNVFWPAPNVDSGLVEMTRRAAPVSAAPREAVFTCIDAAFAQRRKTLRSALAGWAGGPDRAEHAVRAAGVDPGLRGERLSIEQFAAIAAERPA